MHRREASWPARGLRRPLGLRRARRHPRRPLPRGTRRARRVGCRLGWCLVRSQHLRPQRVRGQPSQHSPDFDRRLSAVRPRTGQFPRTSTMSRGHADCCRVLSTRQRPTKADWNDSIAIAGLGLHTSSSPSSIARRPRPSGSTCARKVRSSLEVALFRREETLLSRGFFVREGGLEPPRPFGHQHLKLARLPFRHSRKVERRSVTQRMTGSNTVRTGPATGLNSDVSRFCACHATKSRRHPAAGRAIRPWRRRRSGSRARCTRTWSSAPSAGAHPNRTTTGTAAAR